MQRAPTVREALAAMQTAVRSGEMEEVRTLDGASVIFSLLLAGYGIHACRKGGAVVRRCHHSHTTLLVLARVAGRHAVRTHTHGRTPHTFMHV